jgi:putative ABC transport system permease protein
MPDVIRQLRALGIRLIGPLRGNRADNDFAAELESHVAMHTEDGVRAGLPPEEARRRALILLGGAEQTRQALRERRTLPWLENLAQDLRYGLRALRRSPGFTVTAVLTLALGIGACTAVFSVVNMVLLKPFAFRDPSRLVVMREVAQSRAGRAVVEPDNYRHYLRLISESRTLEDAAIFQNPGESISPSGDRPHIVGAVRGSPNLLRVLGVQPLFGRDFVAADAVRDATHEVILSYEGWQTLFQGDPKVLGRSLRLGGYPASVIGVLPPGVRFPQIETAPGLASQTSLSRTLDTLIYEPYAPTDWDLKTDSGNFNYKVIARLRPGVSLVQARAELQALQISYSISAHLPIRLGISLTPLAADVTSGIGGALWLLFAAVAGVLLIACVNLANLQLARAIAFERETAVRAALGASKIQLVTARLTESLLLALIGGAAGVVLAFAGVRLLLALVPANVPRINEVQVNLPVLLFAAGVSIAAAVLFGVLPALHALRVQPQTALQANSTRCANTQEGRQTRSLLVACQMACTVVLLIVTSLVLRSFSHLLSQNRGFNASHVTLAQVDLYAPQYDDSRPDVKAAKLAFANRAIAALQQLPAVQSVAITSAAPLAGETWVDNITLPDHPVPESQKPAINVRWINPAYLPTMQIPLVAGRNIDGSDRANPYVALISERTAREAFPGENPIGRQISDIVPDDQHSVTIIGVVADTRINGLKDTAAMVYLPYWDFTPWQVFFLVRSGQPSDALIPQMRRVLWNTDPKVAIPLLRSMDEQVGDSIATERLQAIVLTSFGAAALLLALLGIYGVLAYSVSLRRQEFGIRIALGSGKPGLVRLVLRQAAAPVLFGTAAGLVLAFIALRWVRSLLYETPVLDPAAIGGSLLLLLAAAALAAFIPARRAASVDPMQALRAE